MPNLAQSFNDTILFITLKTIKAPSKSVFEVSFLESAKLGITELM